MGKGAAFDECACYTTRRAARQLGQAYDRALRERVDERNSARWP